MKLEFLDDISKGGKYPDADPNQLIRLFDFDTIESQKFKEALQKNIIQDQNQLVINDLDFITPINCTLKLSLSNANIGIRTKDKTHFICELDIESYLEMIEIIDWFCREKENNSYNWLYDLDTPIDFLYSTGGSW